MNTEELARYIKETTYKWLPEYRYEDCLITFGPLPYCPPGGTCVFSNGIQYYYIGIGDRGSIGLEKHTRNIDELFLWVLDNLVTMVSYYYAKESVLAKHNNDGFRRIWHEKRLELAARCGTDFYEYTRKQIEDTLSRHPYSSEE